MSQKASSLSARNFLRRAGDSISGRSKGTKDGDPHDGTVVASPVKAATPSQNIAGRSMTGMDTSQPAQSSPVPVSMALQSPAQVASSHGPSVPSVQKPPLTSPTAAPAPTAPSATIEPMTLSGPEDLWDQAYDDLKNNQPKLLEYYEAILSRELGDSSKEVKENGIEKEDRTTRRSQMDRLLNTGLDRTKKLADVENNMGDAINIVLSVKDAISSALQPVPIAALAWMGVCVALEVSLPSMFICWLSPFHRYFQT
jgi:N-terminal domain of NWD NACHT-NTPase